MHDSANKAYDARNDPYGAWVILLALQHGQEALMDADVLLLSLNHPDAFAPHLVDDAEDVDDVGVNDLLDEPVQRDESARAADAGGAVDHDGPHLGNDALPEGAHEPD